MAKIINIHTGKEVDQELKVPNMECSICDTEFDLDDECGMTGYFGMLMVYFCQFCFSSMIDMSKQILGINDEEESE